MDVDRVANSTGKPAAIDCILSRDSGTASNRKSLRAMGFVLSLLLMTSPTSSRATAPAVHLLDLTGHVVEPLQEAHVRASVLIFTRTDCPISNRYAPVIEGLNARFAAKGISFWLVYVDPHQSADEIRQHVKDYRYHLRVALDPKHRLAKLAGAQVTPEAAVFSEGQLVYRGRIDNRYVDFGKALPAPTRNDLELALDAVLAARPIPQKTTRAVGCYISDLE